MVTKIEMTPGGPALSRVVLGMMNLSGWNLTTPELVAMIEACLEMGVTTFDHADIYGGYTCEEIFGRALAQSPGLRGKMQLITKCGIKLVTEKRPGHQLKSYDTSAAHLIGSVENSLKMLHTDTIDLLLIHRPDALLDADEVAEVFEQLRTAGKVQHFGVSNFMPWQFDLLASRLDFPLVTNQVEISVTQVEMLHNGVVDQCQQYRLTPMAWSPLGGGRFFKGDSPQDVRLRAALGHVGAELDGAGLDQVALAWLMNHPTRIIPVLGTGNIGRVQKAAEAAHLTLTREQWYRIWQASTGHEVP